jgi:hypothetical protein
MKWQMAAGRLVRSVHVFRASLGRGSSSFVCTSSDCFFHCLNRCGDPGDVAMVDNDVHTVRARVCVCVAARFVSLSDGAKRAQRPL